MTTEQTTLPRLEMMSLSDCIAIAHPRNPKEHALAALSDSFVRFGFVAFPTIDEATQTMVAGHGRCEALAQMKFGGMSPPRGIEIRDGDWFLPVVRGVRFQSELERDAYVVADNQQVLAGGWHFDQLADLLRELKDAPNGFDGLGFETVEIDSLLGNYIADPPDDGFDPEVRTHGGGGAPPEIAVTVTCPECGHRFVR